MGARHLLMMHLKLLARVKPIYPFGAVNKAGMLAGSPSYRAACMKNLTRVVAVAVTYAPTHRSDGWTESTLTAGYILCWFTCINAAVPHSVDLL